MSFLKPFRRSARIGLTEKIPPPQEPFQLIMPPQDDLRQHIMEFALNLTDDEMKRRRDALTPNNINQEERAAHDVERRQAEERRNSSWRSRWRDAPLGIQHPPYTMDMRHITHPETHGRGREPWGLPPPRRFRFW